LVNKNFCEMKKDIDEVLLAKYFAEECTDAEVQQISAWMNENAENKDTVAQLKDIWKESQDIPPDFHPDVEKAWSNVSNNMKQTSGEIPSESKVIQFFWRRTDILGSISRIAAILIVVIGVPSLIVQLQRGDFFNALFANYIDIENPKGKRSEHVLPDGSKIWLNAYSKIRYLKNLKGSKREIALTGEAYFKVVRDTSKPFIVKTRNSVTEVLGTSFNVRAFENDDELEVSVSSGKVSFAIKEQGSGKSNKIVLHPGEKGIYNRERNALSKMTIDGEDHIAWKKSKLLFRKIKMSKVEKMLERWYNIEIEMQNNNLRNCRFTASFLNASLEEVFKIITITLDVEVNEVNGIYVFSGKGC